MARSATDLRPASPLPALAIHGARLEAAGAGAAEIARQTGVALTTVKRWRARPDYQSLLERLREQANDRIIERATSVRLDALRLVEESLTEAAALLDSVKRRRADPDRDQRDPYDADAVLGAREVAAVLKAGLDAYRATAAQTGISEATRHEVEVTAPEEVRKMLRADVDTLTDEELDALRARRGE